MYQHGTEKAFALRFLRVLPCSSSRVAGRVRYDRSMKRALICAMFLFPAAPVWADATVFIGANMTPANRAVRGGALGAGLLIIGFEGEYAFTPDDPAIPVDVAAFVVRGVTVIYPSRGL